MECNIYILLHKRCTFLYRVSNNKSLKCQYTYTHKLDHCYCVLERWMYALSCLLLFAWLCFFNLHTCILLQIVKIFPLLCFFCWIVFWNNNTWLIIMIVRTWTHHEICFNLKKKKVTFPKRIITFLHINRKYLSSIRRHKPKMPFIPQS